jgi:hypothetical protein
MSAIFKMAAKTRHKKWAVKLQHCPISSKFDMWVDNDVLTLKNFYRLPLSRSAVDKFMCQRKKERRRRIIIIIIRRRNGALSKIKMAAVF